MVEHGMPATNEGGGRGDDSGDAVAHGVSTGVRCLGVPILPVAYPMAAGHDRPVGTLKEEAPTKLTLSGGRFTLQESPSNR